MLKPIILSLKIATLSTIINLILVLFLAHIMTYKNFKGKSLIESIITMPLVLPPSVTGYILLLLLGKNGPFGKLLYNIFGINIVFTWVAALIASIVITFPLMYQSIKAAFSNIDPIYSKAADTLGANRIKIFFTITIPLSIHGIISGVVLAFTRALGEFGATLMIAGNIPNKTQTIPTAIYFATESGDSYTANVLVLIMTLFSFTVMWGLNYWSKKNHYLEKMRYEKC